MSTELTPDQAKALEDIRREVIEARNMTIKTDNALKTLHAELKVVSQHQEDFQKRTWFSTGAAYLGFAALCGAGAFALSGTRAASALADKDRLDKQLQEASAQVTTLKNEAAATAAAERSASEVWRMMTSLPGEERLKGIDALSRLDQQKLSPFALKVLQDRAGMLRKEVGATVFEKGVTLFKKQDWPGTIEQMNRFLTMNPGGEDTNEAHYYLGNAALQSRKFDDAVKHLGQYVETDKRAKNRDFAMLLLMQGHDALGNKEKAVDVAKEAFQTYPASEFRGAFYLRMQRGTGAAPAPAPAAPAPAAPGAPAPTPAAPGPQPH